MSDRDHQLLKDLTSQTKKIPLSKVLQAIIRSREIDEEMDELYEWWIDKYYKSKLPGGSVSPGERSHLLSLLKKNDFNTISNSLPGQTTTEPTKQSESPKDKKVRNDSNLTLNKINGASKETRYSDSQSADHNTPLLTLQENPNLNIKQNNPSPLEKAIQINPLIENESQNRETTHQTNEEPLRQQIDQHMNESIPIEKSEAKRNENARDNAFIYMDESIDLTFQNKNINSEKEKKHKFIPRTSDERGLGWIEEILEYKVEHSLEKPKLIISESLTTGLTTKIDSVIIRRDPRIERIYYIVVSSKSSTDMNKSESVVYQVNANGDTIRLENTKSASQLFNIKPIINETVTLETRKSPFLLITTQQPNAQDQVNISDVEVQTAGSRNLREVMSFQTKKGELRSVFEARQYREEPTAEFEFFVNNQKNRKLYYSRNVCEKKWDTEYKQTIYALDLSEYSSYKQQFDINFDCSNGDTDNSWIVLMLYKDHNVYKFLFIKAITKRNNKNIIMNTDLFVEGMLNTKIPVTFSSDQLSELEKTRVFGSWKMKFFAVAGLYKIQTENKHILKFIFLNVCDENSSNSSPSNRKTVELFLPSDDTGYEDYGKFNSFFEHKINSPTNEEKMQLLTAQTEFEARDQKLILILFGVTHTSELGYLLVFKESGTNYPQTLRVSWQLFEPSLFTSESVLTGMSRSVDVEATNDKKNFTLVFAIAFETIPLIELHIDISTAVNEVFHKYEKKMQEISGRRR